MGMYNEVFKKCPNCGGCGYLQIHQIVLGFGGFNLDSLESIAEELSVDEIKELKDAVENEWFICRDCDKSFKLNEKDDTNEKMKILNSIGDKSDKE